MKKIALFLFSLTILVFPSLSILAGESQQVTKVTFNPHQKNEFKTTLISYKNHLDELEVRIEATGMPRFASQINPLIGFGRDTDQNGKVDMWFFITKNGIDRVNLEGSSPIGSDILGKLLDKKYQTTFSMYVASATTSLLSYVLMTGAESRTVTEDYYRDWMDLEEMKANFEKEFDGFESSYTYSQMMYHYRLSSIGYNELARRTDSFAKKTFWGYALADIGLWVTGGIVFEWGGKVLTKIGMTTTVSTFVNSVRKTFFGFLDKQKVIVEKKLANIKGKMNTVKINTGMKIAEKELVTVLTVATWKTALKHTIKAQKVKRRIQIAVRQTIKWPKNIYTGAKTEWKYIAMNSSVQVGSEAIARWDDIKDNNPAVVAQNLLTNPEVLENVSFMAAETILMTGISKNLKTTKARFMASGAIALTNSSIMNFAIKEDADPKRIAFDTAWEVLIGNAQVQLDLKGLEYFEKLALKKNNPKIKLIGYGLALIDMGVGYISYSKITTAIDKMPVAPVEPKVMLVPILVEMP
jgi:hypothetical protein